MAKRVSGMLESEVNAKNIGYEMFQERKSGSVHWTFDEKNRERDFLMVPIVAVTQVAKGLKSSPS